MKTNNNILTREDFRNSVFKRDSYKCVVCGNDAVDAHHILDRSLFMDGGYYIDNGVSLCSKHHIEAESGVISPDYLRYKANIEYIVLPQSFDETLEYNKWGEPIAEGNRFKYPRTKHLSFSEGVSSDDKILYDLSSFEGQEIIASEKRDGENTSMTPEYYYARSLDSNNHPSRNWVKGLWGNIRYNIPHNWRICGENLYAKHSIGYNDLDTYFEVFNIWTDSNVCLSWDDTVEWCELLGLKTVPVLYRGIFDIDVLKNIKLDTEKQEGFVIRLAGSFKYSDFGTSVAKWVRNGHVQTDEHWTMKEIIKNNLK